MRRIVDTSDPVNWSHPLNRGLVSWWLALPDQQRGVIWRDLCRRNPSTLTSGPTWQGARGRPGGWGSLSFDGSDDYATAADNASLNFGTGEFFVSFWLRIRSAPSIDTGVIFKRTSVSAGYEVIVNTTRTMRGVAALDFGGNTAAIPLNQWAFVVVSRGAGVTSVYLDGVFSRSAANTTNSTSTNPLNFAHDNLNTRFGAYDLDDVRIGARSLSESHVSHLYKLSRQGSPGLLNRLPNRRYAPEQAVAGGLSIPIAAYHYNHHLGSMA